MLRTIVFFAFFWLALLATTPVCVFFLLLRIVGLGPATREATGAVIRAFARLVMRAAGTRVTCSGLEKAPRGGKLVVVANHQGLMDIFAVVACLPRAVGFVAKLQAIWIPFIFFATGSAYAFHVANSGLGQDPFSAFFGLIDGTWNWFRRRWNALLPRRRAA